MKLKPCHCGGAAAIRTEKAGRVYIVRAVCESCGRRGKKSLDTQKPAEGSASIYWATMSWNVGLYEEAREYDRAGQRSAQSI